MDPNEDAPVDGELKAAARRLLQQSPYLAVRRVVCDVCDGIITLTGRVPSYHQKQVAQNSILLQFAGRLTIDNRVVVSDR